MLVSTTYPIACSCDLRANVSSFATLDYASGFMPVIYRYGKIGGDYSFITWDYRGLFSNGPVTKKRRLAIHYHAQDLNEILEAEKRTKIDVLYGFSMGVQVALEYAVTEPEKIDKLVLLNGTYGNVMQTLYQPFFRVPFGDALIYQATKLVTSQIPLLIGITKYVGYYMIVCHRSRLLAVIWLTISARTAWQ